MRRIGLTIRPDPRVGFGRGREHLHRDDERRLGRRLAAPGHPRRERERRRRHDRVQHRRKRRAHDHPRIRAAAARRRPSRSTAIRSPAPRPTRCRSDRACNTVLRDRDDGEASAIRRRLLRRPGGRTRPSRACVINGCTTSVSIYASGCQRACRGVLPGNRRHRHARLVDSGQEVAGRPSRHRWSSSEVRRPPRGTSSRPAEWRSRSSSGNTGALSQGNLINLGCPRRVTPF